MKKLLLVIALLSIGAANAAVHNTPAAYYWTNSTGKEDQGHVPTPESTNIGEMNYHIPEGLVKGPVRWKTYNDWSTFSRHRATAK